MQYSNSYLYFNTEVVNTEFKTLVEAKSVHYCTKFTTDSLYLERHDTTRYTATIELQEGIVLIITEYEQHELESKIRNLLTPISSMKNAYDMANNNKCTPQ